MAILMAMTRTSKMTLACGMDHQIETAGSYDLKNQSSDERGRVVISVNAIAGHTVRLTKTPDVPHVIARPCRGAGGARRREPSSEHAA